MTRLLAAAFLLASQATAAAQDVVSLAPPEMESVFGEPDPCPGVDVVRVGLQLDVMPDVALLRPDFGGTLAWRPPEAAVLTEDLRARPQLAFRVHSAASGTQVDVAHRTVTAGPELALEAAYSVEARLGGPVWALARLEGLVGLQQASVQEESAPPDAPDRFLTVGVLSAGPRVGLVAGPVLVAADLAWHTTWHGTETFPTFARVLRDGPYLGVSLMLRLSPHAFLHGRVLPSGDEAFPRQRWMVGLSASFDPLAPPAEPPPRDDVRLHFHYPRVRPIEYLIAFGSPIVFGLIDQNTRNATRARWDGGNFFDGAFVSLVGDNSENARAHFGIASDVTWYASMAYPFVDAVLVALIADGNPDVAWQMTALNIQAIPLSGFVTLLIIRAAARTRPKAELCLEDGGTPEECGAFDMNGFPSGHTTGSFAGAGLPCAHHLGLDLYGGGAPDVAACVAALTVATATGVFRIAADKHHATDVLAGAAIGLAAGWLMPWLLHYRLDLSEAEASEVALTPFGDPSGTLGVAALGRF